MPEKILTIRDALRNPTRRQIFLLVMDNPGVSIRRLGRLMNMSIGNLTGHLLILERVGLIREVKERKRSKLFVNDNFLLKEISDLI